MMMDDDAAGGLELVRGVLAKRGWRVESGDDTCWYWPAPRVQSGVRFFHPGPSIYFDEEDPDEGFLVEGPLIEDASSTWLRYLQVSDLILALDRIEVWVYPQTVREIDPEHLDPRCSGRGPD